MLWRFKLAHIKTPHINRFTIPTMSKGIEKLFKWNCSGEMVSCTNTYFVFSRVLSLSNGYYINATLIVYFAYTTWTEGLICAAIQLYVMGRTPQCGSRGVSSLPPIQPTKQKHSPNTHHQQQHLASNHRTDDHVTASKRRNKRKSEVTSFPPISDLCSSQLEDSRSQASRHRWFFTEALSPVRVYVTNHVLDSSRRDKRKRQSLMALNRRPGMVYNLETRSLHPPMPGTRLPPLTRQTTMHDSPQTSASVMEKYTPLRQSYEDQEECTDHVTHKEHS